MANIMIVPTWQKEETDEVAKSWGEGVRDKVQRELVRRQAEKGVDEMTGEGVG